VGLLDHQELMLIKGVGKTPGDTLSAETDPVVVNFLSNDSGFSLEEWSPNIPSLKSSGIWADSPITDGRTLIAGVNTNVTEDITTILTGANAKDFAAQFAKLQRLIQDAREFWDTFDQIDPVYIRWWADSAPGPQFALIYNIDLDVEFLDGNLAEARITLSIEREFGWRGVRPGGNPKEWAIENVFSNQIFSASNAALHAGTDFLLYETGITNRAEQNAGQTGYTTKNFIEVPAASVPGDLPALSCISYTGTTTANATSLLIAKSTQRNTNNPSRATTTNQYIIRVFNAADAQMGTDTTLAADTGASMGISGLQRRSNTTFATATLLTRLTWDYTANGFSLSVLRGRYAVFLRARLSALPTTVTLQFGWDEIGSQQQVLTPVSFTGAGGTTGTGNTSFWGFVYLGEVTLPSDNRRTTVGGNGLGISIDPSAGVPEISLSLLAARTSGVGVLYVNDLILMPIEEGIVNLITTGQSIVTNGGGIIYDNTGYLQHGGMDEYAACYNATSNNYGEYDRIAMTGSPLYLTPKTDNRLEFLAYGDAQKRSSIVEPVSSTIRLSIVPRWSGIRDA
jgi:hypothetical protein